MKDILKLSSAGDVAICTMSEQDGKPPCASFKLMEELRQFYNSAYNGRHGNLLLMSEVPGVFNWGGDLEFILTMLDDKNYSELTKYAMTCIKVLYNYYDHPMHKHTIALIQGDALGGGFEFALASDTIVAESGVIFSFPEIRYNLFPGMGALSFLSRKIGIQKAKHMVTNHQTYIAEELYDMGVVDVLADKGYGLAVALNEAQKFTSKSNARTGITKAMRIVDRVPFKELSAVAMEWVNAVVLLTSEDIAHIENVSKRQKQFMKRPNDRT